MHISKPLLGFFVALILVACQPQPTLPPAPELDQNELATLVMGTMEAIQSTEAAAHPSATALPDILPQSLYFLSERSGSAQVWRLERNGRSLQQITFEENGVLDFDVNPETGAVVFVSEQSMSYLADGSEVTQSWQLDNKDLQEGLPEISRQFSSPRISPDGRWLAYAQNSVHLIDLNSGESLLILADEYQELDSGALIPGQLYFPESWSPDGTRLLVSIAYIEAGSLAFLDLETQQLTDLQASGIVCCQATWASDSQSIYVASPYLGLIDSGLWQYAAEDGAEAVLIPSSGEDATINLAGWPYSTDGELRFFYSKTAGIPEGDTPLFMVEAKTRNAENPQSLRDDAFQIEEALWAPDGSLAVILPILQGESGPLVLARVDGTPLEVLVDDAWNLKWGP